MAYAKSLPLVVIRICKWVNISFLVLNTIIFLDVFLLPRNHSQEKILSIYENHVTYTNILKQRVTKPLENVILVSDNFHIPFRGSAIAYLEQADSVKVTSTRLLKIVEKTAVSIPSLDKELKQEAAMFNTFMFIPIAFVFISIVGVVLRHNREQLLNATVMNIILFVILLLLINYS